MSTRLLQQAKTPTRELVIIAGSFAPAGTGAPTAVKGDGFSVARTAAGKWTITLDKVFPELESATATLQLASATDLVLQFGAIDLSAKTIVLSALAATTATDISANANNVVHFSLALKNTGTS